MRTNMSTEDKKTLDAFRHAFADMTAQPPVNEESVKDLISTDGVLSFVGSTTKIPRGHYQSLLQEDTGLVWPQLVVPCPATFFQQDLAYCRSSIAVLAFRASFHKITGRILNPHWNPLANTKVTARVIKATDKLREAEIRPYPWALYRLSQIIDEDATDGMATGRFTSVFGATSVSKKNLAYYLSGCVDTELRSSTRTTDAHKEYLAKLEAAVTHCSVSNYTIEQASQYINSVLTKEVQRSYSARAQVEAQEFSSAINAKILAGTWVWS